MTTTITTAEVWGLYDGSSGAWMDEYGRFCLSTSEQVRKFASEAEAVAYARVHAIPCWAKQVA